MLFILLFQVSYPVTFLFIWIQDGLHLLILGFDLIFQITLFIVEFVLEGQEMLIQGNPVSQKRFIATSLVLLVNLSLFEQFDLSLHSGNLFLEIQDDFVF